MTVFVIANSQLTVLGEVLAALNLVKVHEQDSGAIGIDRTEVIIVGQRDALLLDKRRLQSFDGILNSCQICFLLDFMQVLEARLRLEFALAEVLDRQAVLDEHHRQRFLLSLRLHERGEFLSIELSQGWEEAGSVESDLKQLIKIFIG